MGTEYFVVEGTTSLREALESARDPTLVEMHGKIVRPRTPSGNEEFYIRIGSRAIGVEVDLSGAFPDNATDFSALESRVESALPLSAKNDKIYTIRGELAAEDGRLVLYGHQFRLVGLNTLREDTILVGPRGIISSNYGRPYTDGKTEVGVSGVNATPLGREDLPADTYRALRRFSGILSSAHGTREIGQMATVTLQDALRFYDVALERTTNSGRLKEEREYRGHRPDLKGAILPSGVGEKTIMRVEDLLYGKEVITERVYINRTSGR